MSRLRHSSLASLALLGMLQVMSPANGQALRVDATAASVKPIKGHLHMGTSVSPRDGNLTVNSQYLVLNDKAWLPVMGEFHFSRSPQSTWASELAKMRASGVDIVATYVFWNHHEEVKGNSNWKGSLDLGRFVKEAGKAGLKVIVRMGPWSHGEVRYGGVPDWVVDAMPTRRNDKQYMGYVARHYEAIGRQLRGQLWKDGGPVIGVQLENEYNLGGPGQGEEHIKALKSLALKAGIDVPMYTVTGWDGALYPSGEVIPVFGGYPDEPWGNTASELPAKETYAFRFNSRVSGDLGAQTAATQPGTAESDIDRVPFFGAEYGVGVPAMYRRRPLISQMDAASMLPVQLGSGVNLLGYYMYHGGRNPVGRTSLEESTLSGGYNDLPRINYDFSAPLGPDGQERAVMGQLRPMHYFLNDFGDRLAPMTVRKPDQTPTSPTDLASPRWAVRSAGQSGFVFFNNHVRQSAMPARAGVQFDVALPGGQLTFPSRPFNAPDGLYFVWPFNFDLDGTNLEYATAQPVARLDAGSSGVVYVFASSPGVATEFKIGGELIQVSAGLGSLRQIGETHGRRVSILTLTPEQAKQVSLVQVGGRRHLILSDQQVSVEGGQLQLRSIDQPTLEAAIFPGLDKPRGVGAALAVSKGEGAFQKIVATMALGRSLFSTLCAKKGARLPASVSLDSSEWLTYLAAGQC